MRHHRNASRKRDNQAAPVSAGREATAGNRCGTGAPPSNTAPDNSNPSFFQPLRWGVDSLYLSYPGGLFPEMEANLKALKKQAQGKDHEAAKAQLALGDHIFEVRDKSSGLFAYSLADGAFEIRLSSGKSKTVPMAYVQVRSGLLAHRSVDSIEQELRGLLRLMGEVSFPKVSRIDLYVDFASSVDMESWDRDAWVTRASAIHQYAEDSTFTGWAIGAGSSLMGRLYLKSLECRKSGKEYLFDLWLRAGWDGVAPVWRLEFEFRREVLAQLGMDALPHVVEHLGGLWSYASTEWLKLCVPNEADSTRSRWPIHPLWVALASIDWESSGGPLSRTFTATRAPARTWLGKRALSLVASMGSVAGVTSFEDASAELLHEASNSLGDRYSLSGISQEAGFFELVEANNRKYNVRLNDQADDEDDDPLGNPYFRAKSGLRP